MNSKNILFIASITCILAQNLDAMHHKAIKPLSLMRYTRGLKNTPTREKVANVLLITGISGLMISTLGQMCLLFSGEVDISKEIDMKNKSKNNAE